MAFFARGKNEDVFSNNFVVFDCLVSRQLNAGRDGAVG